MAFRLSPRALADGYRLDSFDTIGSTNAVALERGLQGDHGRLWLASTHQAGGRGRRGRPWETPPGNLAATLLLVLSDRVRQPATLGFVAGLTLADALEAVVPEARVAVGVDGGTVREPICGRFALKWPNDVLADGAKLSGILLESVTLGDGRLALAIGIGVNVVSHPTDTPYPATSLASIGASCDAEVLFLALTDAWLDNFGRWAEGRGLEEIRERWLGRAAGIGSQVAVSVGQAVIRGTFETIDEECRFVIRDRAGVATAIAAGDVHFGEVATAAVT